MMSSGGQNITRILHGVTPLVTPWRKGPIPTGTGTYKVTFPNPLPTDSARHRVLAALGLVLRVLSLVPTLLVLVLTISTLVLMMLKFVLEVLALVVRALAVLELVLNF